MTQTPEITPEAVDISFPDNWRERSRSFKGLLKQQKIWADGFNCARDQADALVDRLAEVEAQLKMVLDREAATCARYDAKLDAAEAKQ